MADNCRQWQGLLAEHILTRDRAENAVTMMSDELAEHIDGCADCQSATAELDSLGRALAHGTGADASTGRHLPPTGLSTRIAARVDHERDRRQRRHRLTMVAAIAAAIVLVVGVVTIVRRDSADPNTERVALDAAGFHGNATLQERTWGTQIELAVSGVVPGQHYNVWLERADGSRVGAGTFIGVRSPHITVVLASALQSSSAVAIGISKPDGGLVLRTRLI